MVQKLAIKPYVRLLKMLGEDLIKDEKTAFIELVKNAYDADATWVTVDFKNFGENLNVTAKSEIVIEDNGDGMTDEILKNEWLNPGTSFKKTRKSSSAVTGKGRILQGEKGIGRFAMFKLGRTIELNTKHQDEIIEKSISVDLSNYDDDFISKLGNNKAELLESIEVILSEVSESTFEKSCSIERTGTGTRLTISNLNGTWNAKKIKEVYFDIAALQSISPIINGWTHDSKLEDFNKGNREFTVNFYRDGIETSHKKEYESNLTELLNIIKDKSFLKVKNGKFDDKKGTFSYTINDVTNSVKITDQAIKNLNVYKRYFVEERENFDVDNIECGPFSFEFYIFLLDPKSYNKIESEKYKISSKEEREILKKHRIYLYRDAIRVYPYGDPKDDWLQTDTLRGVFSAGQFFSNDQVVGLIEITHLGNPKLQDKTNREGLISNGEATSEIVALIQTFLAFLRVHDYSNYLEKLENEKQQTQKRKLEEERKKSEEEKEKKDEEERLRREVEERREKEEQKKEVEQVKNDGREEEKKEGNQDSGRNEKENNQTKDDSNGMEANEIAIDMRNKKKNLFFKRSDILKSSVEGSPFSMEYNELIEQLSSLKYEKHYLLFVLAFRVLIENATKKYLVSYAKKDLMSGIGENVNLMIEDILTRTQQLGITQKNTLHSMLGGYHSFRNQLEVIKEEFYKSGNQGSLATKLNALTHNPVRIEEVDALNIANNKILPLIIISEKIMELQP